MPFKILDVHHDIIRALKEQSIVKPTTIQSKSIPIIKSGKDMIGISQTGSGKTAAFGIPILEKIDPQKGLQAIILAPTRELAIQIASELKKFGKYVQCTVTTIYGGVAIDPQIRSLRKANIVVGTPGRVLDHLGRRTIDLSGITTFVLDEADKMVDMGFIHDIRQILEAANKKRQILLFGATISHEIEQIKRDYMHDPATAKAELHVKDDLLAQYYYNCKPHEKFSLLVHLLKKEQAKRVIIFCSTRNTVEVLERNLSKAGFKADCIHGKLTQSRRQSVLKNFHNSPDHILVASAVAARGLDIRDVTHVFNYDLSQDPEEYIHRVGRTARAGASGKAITLLSERDYEAFNSILQRYHVKVTEIKPEPFEKLKFDFGSRGGPRRGGFSGGRGGYSRGGPSRGPSRGGSRGSSSGGRSGFSRGGSRGGPRKFGNRSGSSGRSSGGRGRSGYKAPKFGGRR